ncbi:TetR-like C-terminal domain-containing protein [Streptomyces sp. NPDC087437]|uniref:TetR-like C-terminal domain-containing protein n=1 Tax=Streptomyces sp. NPDC087437 TaxID=3365789 RepID=UPI00381F7742
MEISAPVARATTAVIGSDGHVGSLLRGVGLVGDGVSSKFAQVDAARMVRLTLHGFAILEAADGIGLPREVTCSYHFLVDTLITGLQADPDESTPPEARHDRRPPTREHPETTR